MKNENSYFSNNVIHYIYLARKQGMLSMCKKVFFYSLLITKIINNICNSIYGGVGGGSELFVTRVRG